MAVPPEGAAPPRRGRRRLLHLVAVAVVVVGVGAQLLRPQAPDLGPPPAADTAFDSADIDRARDYRRPLYAGLAAAALLRVAVAAAAAWTRPGRRLVDGIVERVGRHRPARAAAAVILSVVIATDLLLAPLVFWAGYVHAGNFGLRTQGVGGWLYDWAVYHLPVWLGLGVLVLLGYTLARRRPDDWAPIGAVVAAALGLGLAFGAPLVLEPLSYRFTPLAAGAVRTEVEGVLAAADERVDRILVADASRRSIEQNAYISGLGASERVVLFDTLIEERTPAEVGLVLAHELAHRRHADVLRFALLGAAGVVITAYLLRAVLRRRVRQGLQRDVADPGGAAVVLAIVVVLSFLATPVQSLVSRRAEAAADLTALDLTGEPGEFEQMQRGLTLANLTEPLAPAPVRFWWASHPAPMARLGMARWWAER